VPGRIRTRERIPLQSVRDFLRVFNLCQWVSHARAILLTILSRTEENNTRKSHASSEGLYIFAYHNKSNFLTMSGVNIVYWRLVMPWHDYTVVIHSSYLIISFKTINQYHIRSQLAHKHRRLWVILSSSAYLALSIQSFGFQPPPGRGLWCGALRRLMLKQPCDCLYHV